MTVDAHAGHRVNAFAFPADTTSRFILLLVAVIGASLFAFDWLYSTVGAVRTDLTALLACMEQLPSDQAPSGADLELFDRCKAAAYSTRVLFTFAGVGLMLVVALGFYLASFWHTARRFEVLSPEDAPDVVADLGRLTTEAGLTAPPAFVWQPLNADVAAITFGRPGSRTVGLSGGLVVLHGTDLPAFRSILLHELAHLRNRDVDLSHLAVALPRAFLLVAVAPFLLTLFRSVVASPDAVIGLSWRLAVLVVLIVLIRNAVLRTRETFADVRASTQEPEISRVLGQGGGATANPIRALLRLHPDTATRLAAVRDPSVLLRPSVIELVVVGIVGSVAYEELATLLVYLGISPMASAWLAGLPFAPLVAAVVTLASWRGALLDTALGGRRFPSVLLGLGLGLGFLIGQALSVIGVFGTDETIAIGLRPSVTSPAFIVGAAVGSILLVRWTYSGGLLWLPAVARSASPKYATLAAVVAAGFALTTAMAAFAIVSTFGGEALAILGEPLVGPTLMLGSLWVGPAVAFWLVTDAAYSTYTSEPMVVAVYVIAIVFPLVAIARYRGVPNPVRVIWGSLDSDSHWPQIGRPDINLRLPISIGVIVGLGLLVAMVIARIWLRGNIDESVRSIPDFGLVATFWFRSLIIVGTVLAALATAVLARRFGTLQGLFAGLVAAVVGTTALTAMQVVVPCVPSLAVLPAVAARSCGYVPDPLFFSDNLFIVLTIGLVISLLVAGTAATVAERVRFARAASPELLPVDA